MATDHRMNLSAGIASVSVALCLVALKLWALAETGSLAVGAALVDSALDLVMSLGGLAAIAYAARPADEDHAFGHSSAEDLAALGQSLFILVSAAILATAAIGRLTGDGPPPLRAEGLGMAVMAASILMTGALVAWQSRVLRRTGNRVVAADRLHYLGDLVPNLGALVALWASASFGLPAIDPIVALLAAALLVAGGLRIFLGAWHQLMDRAADPQIVAEIERIAASHPGLKGFHDLRTRVSGSRLFVNLHVEIDGDLTLDEAHAIGAALKRRIVEAFPGADVIIHKDPA